MEEGDHTAPDFIENITVKKSLLKSFDCCRLFKETIRFLRADAAHYKKSYRVRKPFRLYFRNGCSFEIILPFLIVYLFLLSATLPGIKLAVRCGKLKMLFYEKIYRAFFTGFFRIKLLIKGRFYNFLIR